MQKTKKLTLGKGVTTPLVPPALEVQVVTAKPTVAPSPDQLPLAINPSPTDASSPTIYVYLKSVSSWVEINTGVSTLTEMSLTSLTDSAVLNVPCFRTALGQTVEGFVTVDELVDYIKTKL